MKNLILLIIAVTGIILISSCSGKKEKTEQAVETSVAEETLQADFTAGKDIYKAKCVVCHQENGQGIAGQFPPLANADYLLADKKRAVEQVLNGSNKQIEVNGVKYSMPMPPQVETHQEAVDVVNYILNEWGNNGGTITLDEVKDIEIVRQK